MKNKYSKHLNIKTPDSQREVTTPGYQAEVSSQLQKWTVCWLCFTATCFVLPQQPPCISQERHSTCSRQHQGTSKWTEHPGLGRRGVSGPDRQTKRTQPGPTAGSCAATHAAVPPTTHNSQLEAAWAADRLFRVKQLGRGENHSSLCLNKQENL